MSVLSEVLFHSLFTPTQNCNPGIFWAFFAYNDWSQKVVVGMPVGGCSFLTLLAGHRHKGNRSKDPVRCHSANDSVGKGDLQHLPLFFHLAWFWFFNCPQFSCFPPQDLPSCFWWASFFLPFQWRILYVLIRQVGCLPCFLWRPWLADKLPLPLL